MNHFIFQLDVENALLFFPETAFLVKDFERKTMFWEAIIIKSYQIYDEWY
jgi:hypothetical protein